MRWDGMFEFQEVPENMLFCPAEVRHFGTTGRPTKHRDKPHDQQFAKVMPRVVGPGVGDVIEGGEKEIHAGNGLQKGDPHPRIHPPENRKTPRIRSDPKRDSPAFLWGAVLIYKMPPCILKRVKSIRKEGLYFLPGSSSSVGHEALSLRRYLCCSNLSHNWVGDTTIDLIAQEIGTLQC